MPAPASSRCLGRIRVARCPIARRAATRSSRSETCRNGSRVLTRHASHDPSPSIAPGDILPATYPSRPARMDQACLRRQWPVAAKCVGTRRVAVRPRGNAGRPDERRFPRPPPVSGVSGRHATPLGRCDPFPHRPKGYFGVDDCRRRCPAQSPRPRVRVDFAQKFR